MKTIILRIFIALIIISIPLDSIAKDKSNVSIEHKKVANNFMKSYLKTNSGIKERKNERRFIVGDLNNDKKNDLIVQYSLDEKDGGSGTGFPEIAVFLYSNSKYDYLASLDADAGGRGGFNVIKIEKGMIYVEILDYDDDDGMCCPSVKSYRKYKIEKNNIIQVKQ